MESKELQGKARTCLRVTVSPGQGRWRPRHLLQEVNLRAAAASKPEVPSSSRSLGRAGGAAGTTLRDQRPMAAPAAAGRGAS